MPSTGYINSNKEKSLLSKGYVWIVGCGIDINKSLYLSIIKRYMLEKHMERV